MEKGDTLAHGAAPELLKQPAAKVVSTLYSDVEAIGDFPIGEPVCPKVRVFDLARREL